MVDAVERFFTEVNDAAKNDETGIVDEKALQGLRDLGAFGMLVKPEMGGVGLTATQYARIVEIVGKYDLGVAVMLGAHQSIGYKGILLVGTDAQKEKYLPRLAKGEAFASFALTEPSCGSDANSIKTRAEPTPDGKHYILNGSKIWITNAGWSEIFTVFAQTPVKDEKTGETKDKVTAFIVERAFGGVSAGPPEKKMGIKCSNTCELFLENVKVPAENILDGPGKGFKVAMNILNNGRFGMIAGMAGTAQICINKAIEHAGQRVQFGKKLSEYGQIQEKLVRMCMMQYVTESMAFAVSANMDQGFADYQLEAAMGKIYGSEAAWYCCDEAIQILGGMGFMVETGLERILRDLRIFRIFEGTNDILRLFVALTGMNAAGKELKGDKMGAAKAWMGFGGSGATGQSIKELCDPSLSASADLCQEAVGAFGGAVSKLLIKHKGGIRDEQYIVTRVADACMEIYGMSCALSRCTLSIKEKRESADYETQLVNTYCRMAHERIMANLKVATSDKTIDLRSEIEGLSGQIVAKGTQPDVPALGF